jgi:hypothetical protein
MPKTKSSVPAPSAPPPPLPLRAPSLLGQKRIPVLPTGELNCPADIDPKGEFRGLQVQVTEEARRTNLTPEPGGMSNYEAGRYNRQIAAEQEQAKRLAAIAQHPQPSEPVVKSKAARKKAVLRKPRRRSRRPTNHPRVAERRKLIRRLGKIGVTSWPDYLAGMDAPGGRPTRADWQSRGCPKSYVQAWNFPTKRKRNHFRELLRNERKNAWAALKK